MPFRSLRSLPARLLAGTAAALIVSFLAFGSAAQDRPGASQGAGTSNKAGADDAQDPRKVALEVFNPIVGGWRGTGMPKRGSTVGAWRESAEWVWDFARKDVALRYDVKDGQLLQSARITYDPATKKYHVAAKFKGDVARDYVGTFDENKLVAETVPDGQGEIHRVTVTLLNDKRTLVLHEKRRDGQSFATRIAEVGYTREGTRLAIDGAGEPECIVTGGKGTIPVTYMGKTYLVCCTGCKQAFDDDPAGTIAAYLKKKAAKTEPK